MNEQDKFINSITYNSTIKKRKYSLKLIYTIWFALCFLLTIIISSVFGHRETFSYRITDVYFTVSLISIILLALASLFSTYYLSTPRAQQSNSLLKAVISSALLWISAIIYLIYNEVIDINISRLIPHTGINCTKNIFLLSIIPLALIFIILKKEYPTKLSQVSFYAAISATSLGALGTHLTCPTDNGTHIIVWHLLPISLITIAVTYFGKKILKW